jgi:hypothetical protein
MQLQRDGYGSLLEYRKHGHPYQVNRIDLLSESILSSSQSILLSIFIIVIIFLCAYECMLLQIEPES